MVSRSSDYSIARLHSSRGIELVDLVALRANPRGSLEPIVEFELANPNKQHEICHLGALQLVTSSLPLTCHLPRQFETLIKNTWMHAFAARLLRCMLDCSCESAVHLALIGHWLPALAWHSALETSWWLVVLHTHHTSPLLHLLLLNTGFSSLPSSSLWNHQARREGCESCLFEQA